MIQQHPRRIGGKQLFELLKHFAVDIRGVAAIQPQQRQGGPAGQGDDGGLVPQQTDVQVIKQRRLDGKIPERAGM